MVVTDICFPDFSGGSRRTLETARILRSFGHEIVIFSNRRPKQKKFGKYKQLTVYRQKMIDIAANIREPVKKILNLIKKKNKSNRSPELKGNFDSHLDPAERNYLKEIYRHVLPLHKFIKVFPCLPKLLKIIKKEQIDIIYERGPSYGIGVIAAKITSRLHILDFIDVLYWKSALKATDRILAYFTKNTVPRYIPRKKIDLVYTCVDEQRFSPNNKSIGIRKKYHIDESTNLGIYVGGFYSWHGLDTLIDAAVIMKEKAQDHDIKFMLVGAGDMYKNVKERIKDEGLEDFIILTNRVDFDSVPSYIQSADFCLSLNTGDAIGLKLFEYLASQKPVIVTRVDLIPVFFKDKENMVFTKPNDPNDLIEKINYIINNPEKSEEISKNARTLVKRQYTWQRHGKNIISSIGRGIRNKMNDDEGMDDYS